MPNAYLQGIQGAFDTQAQIRNDVSVVAINWYVNRCPLVTRIPRIPVESTTFSMISRSYRARTAVVAAAIAATDSQVTLVDASPFMNGDVLQLASGERVEITADPNLTTNVIQVRRSAEGTTAATGAINDVVRLIGNSRTGAEINQNGVAFKPTGVSQYCQTWQHPVQVSGALQASRGFSTPIGVTSPFDENKMDALQNLMDDMEASSYYGLGEAPFSGSRPKQKGLRALLSANLTTSPVNAGAYKPTDFLRDTIQACRTGGGDPDVLIVSTNFMTGLATWGQPAQRIDAGVNVFGVPIDVFEAPFLGGLSLIEAPLLQPYTAICLTSSEVRFRVKRNPFWNPRGVRGDALEGDWIAEGAIEVDNPTHHAWGRGDHRVLGDLIPESEASPVAKRPFPGFPAYLDLAAARIGCPEAAGPARRIEALGALANLCAQAIEAEPAHVAAILAKAAEFRDQLRVASEAAELMLDDAGPDRVDDPPEPSPPVGRGRAARKRTARTERRSGP